MSRKLASIQKIKNLESIEGADVIEKATVLGWSVVVKKGEFSIGDYCVFFEIDSLLPDEERYSFLKKSSWNSAYQRIRLKTIKLRGTLSQGLALPLKLFPEINFTEYNEGEDLTEILGVEKYETPIPPNMSGKTRRFTWPISKTDEIRIQQDPEYYLISIKNKPYYITVKLDGTSASYILLKNDNDEIEFHACSRNYSIRFNEDNTIWQMAIKYDIEEKLTKHYDETGEMLAIQGEICGPGIQKNRLGLKEHNFYIFNVISVNENKKLPFPKISQMFPNIPFVPILEEGEEFSYETMNEILELAKGKYCEHFDTAMPKQEREGIVIRSKDQSVSFKAISNDFLLKEGE